MVLALCALLKWNLDLWTFTDRIAVGMLKIIPLQPFFNMIQGSIVTSICLNLNI